MEWRTCAECQKEYPAYTTVQRYCSAKCRNRALCRAFRHRRYARGWTRTLRDGWQRPAA